MIIFEELVFGHVSERTREELQRIIEELRQGQACEAIVLGCTELPLAVKPEDSKLPLLDSTRLLARAAIRRSTGMGDVAVLFGLKISRILGGRP